MQTLVLLDEARKILYNLLVDLSFYPDYTDMSERITMTYGVPYSFVPGTKARADEMNANFIDVLDKIESSNSRITTLETDKADATTLDGSWVSSESTIANATSLNGTTDLTISLSSYLPDDGNLYEVMIDANITSSATSGQYCCLIMGGSGHFGCFVAVCRPRSNASVQAGGQAMFLVNSSRNIVIHRASNYYGTANINVKGYRKVR